MYYAYVLAAGNISNNECMNLTNVIQTEKRICSKKAVWYFPYGARTVPVFPIDLCRDQYKRDPRTLP